MSTMSDSLLRNHKESVLRPLGEKLQGVSPTAITLLAFAFGIASAGVTAFGFYTLGLGFWLVNRMLDGIDGSVARLTGRQSDWGGYLDLLLDFIIYALIPIALVLASPSEWAYLTLALLLTSFYINSGSWLYLAALLEKQDKSGNYKTSIVMPGGLIEGAETILFYALFLLFPAAFVPLAAIMSVLVLVTVGQRLLWAKRHLL